jgi:methyl-accepting chemotaxis protein
MIHNVNVNRAGVEWSGRPRAALVNRFWGFWPAQIGSSGLKFRCCSVDKTHRPLNACEFVSLTDHLGAKMDLLNKIWSYLETSVFDSRIKKAVASISVVVMIQLATLCISVYFLTDIVQLGKNAGNTAQIVSTAELCMLIGGAGFLLTAIFCLLIAMMLCYLATKPLQTVDDIFQRLADGRVDWSQDIPDLACPELKHVSIGYNAFMANLRQIIESIRKSGIRIAIGSAQVFKAVDMAGEKTNQQKQLSELVAVSSGDANIAIREVSENAQYVSENTSSNLNKVRISYSELETVAQKVESINRTVATFRDTVEELNRNSSSIMGIISVINNISDQTNLLSLNATIEAARAGEHGKGFAVVAEEVRTLAKRVKPATEDISAKINTMVKTVEKTMTESDAIIHSSMEVSSVIKETATNFKSMIGDFEETDEQLVKIASAIEELSLSNTEVNRKVAEIDGLSQQISTDMQSSGQTVRGLNEITEMMQEMVSQYKTGQGLLDQIIDKSRQHRDHMQAALDTMRVNGINIFDHNYKPIPNTNPQKFTAAFTDAVAKTLQPYCDAILKDIPGSIYALAVDKNGYLPTHHSQVSKPMTGNYERDLLQSRDKRIYFSNQTEVRRATNQVPMLLQTYMRDTGEVINDLSMPIQVDGRHWGAFILGLNPEIFAEK